MDGAIEMPRSCHQSATEPPGGGHKWDRSREKMSRRCLKVPWRFHRCVTEVPYSGGSVGVPSGGSI